MTVRLRLEKLKSPLAFPTGAQVSGGRVWVTSIDRPAPNASGPWVLSTSADLLTWHECLRQPSARAVLSAFGGVVVRGWPAATDAQISTDGKRWEPLSLPTAGASLFSDGRDGLWATSGSQVWRRSRAAEAFERLELEGELEPDRIIACATATFFSNDGRWWRLDGRSLEPVSTLKRAQLTEVVARDQHILGLGAGALWASSDAGLSFEPATFCKHEALCLALVGQHFVVGCRGALYAGDGVSCSPVSENDQAEFSAVASLNAGALVVDRRRTRLFSLAERGASLTKPTSTPQAAPSPEWVEAQALLTELEQPLLAARAGTLGSLRTQAERTEPQGGWQPHLVYLDALQDAGDPDAAVLAALNRLQQGPRFDEYLAAHLSQLVPFEVSTRRDALTWRNGFIDTAVVYGTQVAALLDRTCAHLLRRLVVWGHGDTFDLSALGGTLRGLRELHLDGFFWTDDAVDPHDWGDLSSLWRALGQLRVLSIMGASSRLGLAVLPQCERLTLAFDSVVGLENDLSALRVPALRQLGLVWNSTGSHEWLSVLLARPMPALSEVRLAGHDGDRIAELVARSPCSATCQVLDLSGSQLTDAGLERLLEVKWPALRTVDLRWNRLSPAGRARARDLAPAVDAKEQLPDAGMTWPPNWLR